MTFRTVALEVALTSGRRRALDFLELSKPRLVLMILVTTYVGFYLGSEQVPDYLRLIQTLMGTALTAGGTLALNELLERETDSLMERTRRRPLPEGRVQPLEALIFGLLSTVTGLILLVWGVNVLSALVTALIVGTYLFLYTPLKLRTPLCGVVGAVPGALPPIDRLGGSPG